MHAAKFGFTTVSDYLTVRPRGSFSMLPIIPYPAYFGYAEDVEFVSQQSLPRITSILSILNFLKMLRDPKYSPSGFTAH